MNRPSIRLAHVGDATAIAALSRELLSFYGLRPTYAQEDMVDEIRFHAFGQNSTVEILLAEHPGRLLGMLIFADSFALASCRRTFFIQDLFVTDEAREDGLGRQLMQALASLAESRGVESIDWTADDWNDGARRFYRKLGAEKRGTKLFFRLDGDRLGQLAHEDDS